MVSQMVVPDSSDRGRRSFSELIQCSYDSALAFVKAMGTYTPLVMPEWFTLYPEPPSAFRALRNCVIGTFHASNLK